MTNQDIIMVYTTFPDERCAKRIARDLVELKLAACANIIGGMTSIYEWDGKMMEEGEVLVLFKTVRGRFKELSDELGKRHPYDTPAVIGYDAAYVNERYATWLNGQVDQGERVEAGGLSKMNSKKK